MSSWIAAARWVKENHQFCLVHIPTGNKVTKRKTKLYIDIDEECQPLIDAGYNPDDRHDMKMIEKIVPGAYKVLRGDCVILDAVTAQMLCCIYDALNPVNQKKFDGMNFVYAVHTGWDLYEKSKAPAATAG